MLAGNSLNLCPPCPFQKTVPLVAEWYCEQGEEGMECNYVIWCDTNISLFIKDVCLTDYNLVLFAQSIQF